MIFVPVSVRSAARHRHWNWNIHCRECPRRLLSAVQREERRCRSGNLFLSWQDISNDGPFLSTGHLPKLQKELIEGGYTAATPAAICYKATWPEEKRFFCTVGTLAETAEREGIKKTALIIVGKVLSGEAYQRSCCMIPLYHRVRKGNGQAEDGK